MPYYVYSTAQYLPCCVFQCFVVDQRSWSYLRKWTFMRRGCRAWQITCTVGRWQYRNEQRRIVSAKSFSASQLASRQYRGRRLVAFTTILGKYHVNGRTVYRFCRAGSMQHLFRQTAIRTELPLFTRPRERRYLRYHGLRYFARAISDKRVLAWRRVCLHQMR